MNVGIDIAEVERFIDLDINTLHKIFSAAEIEYIKGKGSPPDRQSQNGRIMSAERSAETAAGIFCAKEAYFKAKGTGIIKSKLPETEIAHSENGQPFYKNDPSAALSISHTKTTAAAVCIIPSHPL
jgi:holo-[acyl-carrier protein] synthase